jgi:hypothetical protein
MCLLFPVADSCGLTLLLLALHYVSGYRFGVLLPLVCVIFTGYVDAQISETVPARAFGRSSQDGASSVRKAISHLLAMEREGL